MSELNYLDLLATLAYRPLPKREDRTGTGTVSTFGEMMRFNLSDNRLPLLTSKLMHHRSIVHELLWFISGSTDVEYLIKNKVSIWNNWIDHTTRRFDEDGKLIGGSIGDGAYGKQWRQWEEIRYLPHGQVPDYHPSLYPHVRIERMTETKDGVFHKITVDQLQQAIHQLKTTPFSRRIIVSAWNPGQLDMAVLPPCHSLYQFYVTLDENGDKHLSCLLYCRSQDLPVGTPFNIAQYALLVHMVAQVVGMKARELVWVGGDCHVYLNQIETVKAQVDWDEEGHYLHYQPDVVPRVKLNPSVTDIDGFTFEDIEILNYVPGPRFHYPVAI